MKHGAQQDFLKIPILNLVLQPSTTAPSAPGQGQLWLDTSLTPPVAKFYNGSSWVRMDGEDVPSGSLLAAVISNFDTQVRTSRLDQMAAPTGAVSMNSQRITSLGDPLSPTSQEAATANWVTNQLANAINGLDWKNSVRVAATSNITLSGTQTIDGVAVVAGDRVLAAGQSSAAANGIYTVAAGAWSRATDADSNAEVTAGMAVPIAEGTANGDKIFILTTNDPITLGTTALTFTSFGGGVTYTASNGVQLVGNDIRLVAPVTVALGGTNATTAAGARTNLQVPGHYSGTNAALAAGVWSTFTHSLNTDKVIVSFRDVGSTQEAIDLDWRPKAGDLNSIEIKADVAYSSGTVQVTVVGL